MHAPAAILIAALALVACRSSAHPLLDPALARAEGWSTSITEEHGIVVRTPFRELRKGHHLDLVPLPTPGTNQRIGRFWLVLVPDSAEPAFDLPGGVAASSTGIRGFRELLIHVGDEVVRLEVDGVSPPPPPRGGPRSSPPPPSRDDPALPAATGSS